MPPGRSAALALAVSIGLACASRPEPAPPATQPLVDTARTAAARPVGGALPPVPVVRGPLALRVMYPAAGAVVNARDSTFLFGSVGTGEAKLTIDGTPVPVHPNGAWLAWLPLAPDSVTPFRLEAWTASETTRVVRTVRPAGWRGPPPGPLWIDSTSLSPVGAMWLPRGEYVTLQARAAEGAELRLRLPGGSYITLSPVVHDEPVAEALRAFDRNPANLVTSMDRDRFAGLLRGRAIGPDPGPLFPVVPPAVPVAAGASVSCGPAGGCPPSSATADTTWPVLEAIRGPDTVRTRWPLRIAALDTLPLVAELDDDTAGTGTTDGLIVGRAVPGGTYQWFFPTGTRAPVSGRVGDELRLALAPGVDAWVSVAEARSAAGTPTGPAVVGSATLASSEDRVTARIPVGRRLPFQVVEEDRSLTVRFYGAVGNVNWIRYPPADSLVRRVRWAQEADQQVTLTFDLGRPVWGYRARWERDDLLLEIRRPPRLDESRPLKGRLIAVDPGHPPAGATGPTGLREAEANLGIALELRRLLEDEGARVLMTRTTDVPLDLWPRLRMADSAGAELLISVHNNALPDGINPFANHGTSVFYNHPGSIPLARAIQAELVRSLGLRDLGIGRGDLALVRGTWMPSVLTEGLFMILPEQEAALRSAEGRRLYASGIAEGVRRFLRERARER